MTIRELRVHHKFSGTYASDNYRHSIRHLESYGLAMGVKLRPRYMLHDRNGNEVGHYYPAVQYYDNGKKKVITVDKEDGDPLLRHLRKHYESQYNNKVEIWPDLVI